MPERLHVTNGESTAETLCRTALGGDVLPWQDALNEGPVPLVPGEQLRAIRARFLSDCGWGEAAVIQDELERRDRLVESALVEGRHVVLWFEHDLYDQLQLLQILALARELDPDPERLELIEVGAFEGRPSFRGLGELTADELESLWPLRRPVETGLLELGRRAWAAFRAPEPTAIEELPAGETAALPHLEAALRRLLEELPAVESGLSRSERQLLESLAGGTRTAGEAFLAVQELEEAPFEGDTWFYRRLAELGGGARTLVVADGEPRFFALTAEGRDVLAGAADRVALLGIDRWLGGTHLLPGTPWRWDREAGRIVLTHGP